MNDDELEAMFRQSLQRHADVVDDRPGRADAAHAGVRRRRHRQLTGLAAAVVLTVVSPLVVLGASNDPATTAIRPPVGPSGWRTESYNGVELRVPGFWAWAGTPHRRPGARSPGLIQCVDRAYPQATSFQDVRPPRGGAAAVPYVARPLFQGTACGSPANTRAPHVWFDSQLAVGSSPRTGVTVSVGGVKVTVYDPDRAEQRAILATVHGVGTDANGCPSRPRRATTIPEPAPADVTSMSVCIYVGGGVFSSATYLRYSTQVVGDASAAVRAIQASTPVPPNVEHNCLGSSWGEVDLIAHTSDGTFVYAVADGWCRGYSYRSSAGSRLLTERSVWLWAVNATAFYLRGESYLAPYLPVS